MLFINHSEIPGKGIVIIEANGPLNSSTSPDFESYIDQLVRNDLRFIVFDAGNLEFISSAGIGAMLYLQKHLGANNGFFIICNLPNEIHSLFNLLGFNRILSTAESRDDAVMLMEEQIRKSAAGEIAIDEIAISDQQAIDEHESPADHGGQEKEAQSAAPKHDSAVPHEPDDYENPLVVECAECKGLIRVKRSGSYQCPYCHTEFLAEKDRTIIF